MSALQKCENCGIEVELFCYKCGKIVGGDEFSDKNALAQNEQNLKDFIAKLNKPIDSKPAPNKAVQRYFDEVARIKSVLEVCTNDEDSDESKKILNGYINEADNFLNQSEFLEIAFVGTIKAGKSTLINALLKAKYASVDTTPETATLTKFKWGKNAEMTITFYTKKEWQKLYDDALKSGELFLKKYNEINAESHKDNFVGKATITEPFSVESLKKYTSSKKAEHFFVKEVLISYPDFPYEKNLMFVDTPGLDDPVPYRSEITRAYIKSAKVVLVCNSVEAMTKDEVLTIYSAFDQSSDPSKVYVLGTQYDKFENPKYDWAKQKDEWSNYLTATKIDDNVKERTCYTKKLAQKNIINVSGRVALLCELYKKGELDDLDEDYKIQSLKEKCYKICGNDDIDANLDRLLEFANVDSMHERIQKDILNDAQDIYNKGIKRNYENLHSEVVAYFTGDIGKKQDTYEALSGGLEAINAQIAKEKDELQELQNAQNELEGVIEQFESQSKETLKSLGEQIEKLIEKNK